MTCRRCGGRAYRERDQDGGGYTGCLICGVVFWDTPPAPFTSEGHIIKYDMTPEQKRLRLLQRERARQFRKRS